MIDIVKAVQEADPSLGTYVIVLRSDSRALDGPERFTPDAQAWLAANAPGGRLARARVPAGRVRPQPAGVVLAQRAPLQQQFAAVVEGEDREGPVQLAREVYGELLADALLGIGLVDQDHVLDHRTRDSIRRCDDLRR